MKPSPARRFITPAIAALFLLALALWQLTSTDSTSQMSGAATNGIVEIDWSGRTLTLIGQTAANSQAVVTFGGADYTATADAEGTYTITIKAEPKSPSRAILNSSDNRHDLLLLRLQKRWVVLQRQVEEATYTASLATRSWIPTTMLAGDALPPAALLILAKDEQGFVATAQLPNNTTAYIYSDGRLVGITKNADAEKAVAFALPASTTQARVDLFDTNSRLALRLRTTLPPTDAVPSYTLSDGSVWVFTDYAAQKGETDETYPGQLIPNSSETSADPTVAEAPQDKGAPPAQNAPSR